MVSNKAVRQALYEKLNVPALTTLLGSGSASLVHAVAPSTATYPLCVFFKSSDVSALRFGGNAFDSQLWTVKGVVRASSPSDAENIDAAARNLLDFGTLTISGGTLMHLARESGIEYAESEGDQTYRHVGGLYRLVVQS